MAIGPTLKQSGRGSTRKVQARRGRMVWAIRDKRIESSGANGNGEIGTTFIGGMWPYIVRSFENGARGFAMRNRIGLAGETDGLIGRKRDVFCRPPMKLTSRQKMGNELDVRARASEMAGGLPRVESKPGAQFDTCANLAPDYDTCHFAVAADGSCRLFQKN